MERLPDVLFNMVLTFCTSAEIVGWIAEAVRTKDEIAPKLLQLAKSIHMSLATMPPTDIFWASERMLTIPTPPPRFHGIDFESAMFWLFHKQLMIPAIKTTEIMYDKWLEIEHVMMQGWSRPFSNQSRCASIIHAFFGTCNAKDRFYIQQILWEFVGTFTFAGDTCVIVNCSCQN